MKNIFSTYLQRQRDSIENNTDEYIAKEIRRLSVISTIYFIAIVLLIASLIVTNILIKKQREENKDIYSDYTDLTVDKNAIPPKTDTELLAEINKAIASNDMTSALILMNCVSMEYRSSNKDFMVAYNYCTAKVIDNLKEEYSKRYYDQYLDQYFGQYRPLDSPDYYLKQIPEDYNGSFKPQIDSLKSKYGMKAGD